MLYLVLIDSKGNIKEQYTLNEIVNEYNGKKYSTNYHSLLNERGKKRQDERQNWQTIESIKELKEGYLSQVIHKIAQLMVKYNAIVVLEDLNMGFKRSRQCVESSVYQQFEKKLIDKLNFLVDKNLPADANGGLLHAYQLTNKFVSFQKMGKQNGFLFYIPAWNTSKIDPVTGFVNLFDTHYRNEKTTREFFGKFKDIRFNKEKDWFEFEFDYADFTSKAEGTRRDWTICTWGKRIKTFRNKEKNSEWDNEEIELTKAFKDLFANNSINIFKDLKKQICDYESKKILEPLLGLFKLTVQMRNSKTGTEEDYLLSPVADENGIFYCSENCGENLPKNADANGAYNIARKGLWAAMQIRNSNNDKNINLAISNREWLSFVQDKPYIND